MLVLVTCSCLYVSVADAPSLRLDSGRLQSQAVRVADLQQVVAALLMVASSGANKRYSVLKKHATKCCQPTSRPGCQQPASDCQAGT
jgi:hypothetical protein